MSEDPTKIGIKSEDFTDPRVCRMTGYTAHGNLYFDVSFMTEVVPGLWQGGCETGLKLPRDVENLVSLYPWERYETGARILKSELTVLMYDSLDQAFEQVDELAVWVNKRRAEGTTLVHCQAGLNRSSLVVARALMLGPERLTAVEAIATLRNRRDQACLCNGAFVEYLLEFDPRPCICDRPAQGLVCRCTCDMCDGHDFKWVSWGSYLDKDLTCKSCGHVQDVWDC